MGFPCHTQWWRLALLLPKWPSPALPRASVSVGVGVCNVAHHLCPSTERVTQSGNTQVKDEIRHAEQFLCMGSNVWIPKVSQVRTQTASCTQVSASPQNTPQPPGAEGPAAQREPAGIFPAVPGDRAWGCVSCPPILPVFQRQGAWPRLTTLSICCVWNRTGTGGREAPCGLYELIGLTFWQF